MMMSNRKRARIGPDEAAIVGVWRREVGDISSRNFAHSIAASRDLVLRLEILRKLEKHSGCVNTVSFNASGDILVSGSDDRNVLLWDWEMGRVKLSFHSGHSNNVFQAKIMPYTDDRTIVTCAADGQVRLAQIPERGPVETSLLGSHQGRAHKLAIEPGSPYIFYTSGEDGLVQHFDVRTKSATVLFACHSIRDGLGYTPYVHLNAIAIDPRNPNFFAVAGSDEYARLYDIRKYKWDGSTDVDHLVDFFCAEHLINDDGVGITGLAFSDQSELLVSYNNENIYLFSKDMGIGPNHPPSSPLSREAYELRAEDSPETSSLTMDVINKPGPQVYKGHRNRATVKGANFFGQTCEYVVSGSDCGRIFIWRKKGGELIRVVQGDRDVVNCIEPHPHITMLASSGIESDVKIWTPKAEERAKFPPSVDEEMRLQLLPMHNEGSSPEDDQESHISGREFLEMILAFNRQRDDSSHDDGDNSGPEDYFS